MSKTGKPAQIRAPKRSMAVDAATPYMTAIKADGRVYEHRYYEPMHDYDKFKAKKIIVIAFDADNRILGIRNKSGVDVLHGSLTWEDDTREDAARREAREEANVTLGLISLAAVIETGLKDAAPDQVTYTLVMTARIQSIDPYQPWHGVHKRVLLTKEKLLKRLSVSKAKDLRKLLDMAEFALRDDTPEIGDHMRYIMENL